MTDLDTALRNAIGDGASVSELLTAVAAAVYDGFSDTPLVNQASVSRMVRQIQELANRI